MPPHAHMTVGTSVKLRLMNANRNRMTLGGRELRDVRIFKGTPARDAPAQISAGRAKSSSHKVRFLGKGVRHDRSACGRPLGEVQGVQKEHGQHRRGYTGNTKVIPHLHENISCFSKRWNFPPTLSAILPSFVSGVSIIVPRLLFCAWTEQYYTEQSWTTGRAIRCSRSRGPVVLSTHLRYSSPGGSAWVLVYRGVSSRTALEETLQSANVFISFPVFHHIFLRLFNTIIYHLYEEEQSVATVLQRKDEIRNSLKETGNLRVQHGPATTL